MSAHILSRPPPAVSRWFPRLALAACVLLASVAPAAAADWVARHGLTADKYQEAFTEFTGKGYRLVSVSGYDGGRGQARYAAVWRKEAGPAWAARHGLSGEQYQAAFNSFSQQGYRLSFINGYSVGGEARYAAIWTKAGGPAWAARHGLDARQYQAAVDEFVGKGYSLAHVSAYTVGNTPRFAAIFEKGGPAWVARHGLNAAQYQAAFNQFTGQGYRLKVVSGYRDGGGDRYAAIWTKAGGPQWSARHGTPAAHYQAVFDNYRYQSWEPDYVEAFNGGDGVRFNMLWRNTTFAAKDLKLIEDKARAYMRANDMPGLSIAVMRNDRLVYAAGFGVADKDTGMPVSPRHRFRIASVSKPITHVAVVNLANTTSLDLGDEVFGAGSILGGTYATPQDNQDIEDITVDHLIRHRAGFRRIDKDGNGSDPMFAYSGTGHAGLINWALQNYPLGYTPGTTPAGLKGSDMYSNFGYCLLGRVIEARTGKSYEAYVRDTLLKPAGAGDIVIGGDKLADRRPDEVVYYGGGAYSSVKPERFDSHGGWIARPIDLLRFMRHTDGILAPYYHNGEMSGTTASYDVRAGGFGLVAVSNANNGSTAAMKKMMDEIADGVSSWPSVDHF
ncbi:serine hydrolase [Arenimonas caeni]|jgi:CubicO group peptidase (beta-lactamase class C family)|uniref:serine hydrolase n=1 Tax=Arenimonas caeni TaxID=2058085 RepID=UPI002A36BC57|nr:serine hydrolase [Arenimonas caeni]MDY0023179.1 serine hydrolase [Arenimonas caeni]